MNVLVNPALNKLILDQWKHGVLGHRITKNGRFTLVDKALFSR